MTVLVLNSGGINSATLIAMAKNEDSDVHSLTIDYGQRNYQELESAKTIAEYYQISPWGLTLNSFHLLTKLDQANPEVSNAPGLMSHFLASAYTLSEYLGADSIWIGFSALENKSNADYRDKFISTWKRIIGISSFSPMRELQTPFIFKYKFEVISLALDFGAPLELTWSCSVQNDLACGYCDSCETRLQGYRSLKLRDVIRYDKDVIL